jgi:hypothetical protein
MPDRWFPRLVATLDTSGGHMLICLFVIGLGALFASIKLPKGEDLIVAGAATLFQAMRGRGSENHLPNAAVTTTKTETASETGTLKGTHET